MIAACRPSCCGEEVTYTWDLTGFVCREPLFHIPLLFRLTFRGVPSVREYVCINSKIRKKSCIFEIWKIRILEHCFGQSLDMPYAHAPFSPKFLMEFCRMDSVNVPAKFEVRTFCFTRSWDNRGYLKHIGQSLGTPTLPFLQNFLMVFCSDWTCECTDQIWSP